MVAGRTQREFFDVVNSIVHVPVYVPRGPGQILDMRWLDSGGIYE